MLNQLSRLMPLVPLMYGPIVAVSSWKLRGFDVSPMGVPHFAEADLDP